MNAKQWDVVVVGGANWDYLVRGPKLPAAGETVPGNEFQEAPGGKGANQAVAAARLGARVAFVARIGNDRRGDHILDRLADESVNTEFVVRDPVEPTGIALVMVDWEGEKQVLTAPQANRLLALTDVDRAAEAIRSSRVLLTQLEIPVEVVARALAIAREAAVQVVLDSAPPVPLSNELLGLVGVIRANAGEVEVLTGMSVRDRTSARAAADELIRRGAKATVIQAGSDGNLVVSNSEEHWLAKLRVPAVDSTGAGDAFAAALAVMLAEGRSLPEAARFANAAAAQKTTVLGAQAGLPYRQTVMAMLDTQEKWQLGVA
jgi:ribokinase